MLRKLFALGLLSVLVLATLATSCGGESSSGSGGAGGGSGSSGGGGGGCVGGGSCAIEWKLVDACSMYAGSDRVELAVFAGACPPNATLASGDTSAAMKRATFALSDPIPPVTGLGKQTYGFAFLMRSITCEVPAYGCTEADLSNIKGIITAVCDWSDGDKCACVKLLAGSCPKGESCTDGNCSGASGG